MQIEIDSETLRLEDVDNFKAFKVVARFRRADYSSLAVALKNAGRIDGDHVWIYESWIRGYGAAKTAGWNDQFRSFVEFASSRGWYNAQDLSIRAHIDWVE